MRIWDINQRYFDKYDILLWPTLSVPSLYYRGTSPNVSHNRIKNLMKNIEKCKHRIWGFEKCTLSIHDILYPHNRCVIVFFMYGNLIVPNRIIISGDTTYRYCNHTLMRSCVHVLDNYSLQRFLLICSWMGFEYNFIKFIIL